MNPISCNLGRLGSRLNIIFEPQNCQIRQNALGLFLDEVRELVVGIEDADGNRHLFPFCRQGTPLKYIETRITPTTVTWVGCCVPLYTLMEVTFTAPFWPQDEKTSLWPGFIVTMSARPMNRIRWHKPVPSPDRVKLVFGLPGKGQQFRYSVPLVPTSEDTILADWAVPVKTDMMAEAEECIAPVSNHWKEEGDLLTITVPLKRGEGTSVPALVWVGHTQSEVIEAGKVRGRFRYLRYWPTLDDVVAFGRRSVKSLLKKSQAFDALIARSALPETGKSLFAQSLQSYLMNTWWCELADGREWFSVWEGNCLFHSTVDVEYNTSMFYFAFWPRLLGLTLREWTAHLKKNERGPGRYLDHDMGAGAVANGTGYGHIMGVEEASNFLLLLLAHTRFNGDTGILKDAGIRQAVRDLTDYLLWTDQNGRGFPNEDVWNTVDDGAPAIQFGKEQTYLAVKRLAALRAAAMLDGTLSSRCSKAIATTKRTLKKLAWLGDHFAVCLDKDASKAIDPNTGQPVGKGKLRGWDDYHIYSSNGLLLLLMVDGMTDGDLTGPMRKDIESALVAALGPYGCSHNAGDPLNVWVSQNIWRDLIAHYLGANIPDMTPRYWDLQVFSNSRDQAKCFIDTYLNNNLSRYPRGIVSAGYFFSLAGMRLDRTRKVMKFEPVIREGDLPLFALADWGRGIVPMLRVRNGKGRVV